MTLAAWPPKPQAHDLMVEYKLQQAMLPAMVSTPDLQLRAGADQLFQRAQERSVPFHIFSAGLYDVIHCFLELKGMAQFGIHVVSNMMEFDPAGYLTGFRGHLIHTLNKNSTALQSSEGWARVKVRGG
jgi:5'-nucleotidase